ncbi:AAA family ATPase [Streptomyces sp. NPDC059467]|uniref:AAA family ATPase n=1 Tax=Streptomyces sp. NPDC059467 TaxID=3346844 RepID=UPI0036984C00
MAEHAQPDRQSWTVTLVCGASGVGKSSIAIPLAARYGVPLAEADDIVTALQALTTPQQSPMLHYWSTHPEARSWAPERIAELHFAVADALRPGVEAVIADHIKFGAPVVFEGDYLVPELADGFGGAARAVVLGEPDDERITANLRARESDRGDQRHRARVSTLVGAQLTKRADAVGVPVVPARPWHDGLDRVDRALRGWRRSA